MKITKDHSERAKGLFKANPKIDILYVNEKGEFFTNKNYALASVKGNKSKLAEIENEKAEVVAPKENKASDKGLTITDNNGTVISFPELQDKEEIATGVKGVELPSDKRKNGKPANGTYDVAGTGFVFDGGILSDIIEITKS